MIIEFCSTTCPRRAHLDRTSFFLLYTILLIRSLKSLANRKEISWTPGHIISFFLACEKSYLILPFFIFV